MSKPSEFFGMAPLLIALSALVGFSLPILHSSREPSLRGILFFPLPSRPKYQQLKDAAQLFEKQRKGKWKIEIREAPEAGLADAFSEFSRREMNQIMFTPPDSLLTLRLADDLDRPGRPALSENRFFMGQVIASEAAHDRFRLFSTFFPAGSYGAGLADAVRGRLRAVPEAVIFQQKEVVYFDEAARGIKKELRAAGIGEIRPVIFPAGRLEESWDEVGPKPGALLIFLTWNVSEIHRLENKAGFDSSSRIVFYGDPENPASSVFRWGSVEIRALFWDPRLRFQGDSSYSNCDFVTDFRKNFGRDPDFHASFLYSAFQVLEQESGLAPKAGKAYASITGTVVFDEKGKRTGMHPLYLETSAEISKFLVAGNVAGFCPGRQGPALEFRKF